MAKAAKTTNCFTRRLLLVGVIMLWSSTLLLPAQSVRPFQVQWQKAFGGTNPDYAHCIAVAADGGYMVAGNSSSAISGNKQSTNYGMSDAWLLRLDSRGNKLWERNLGGTLGEGVRDLKRTRNGQWIFVGESASSPSGNKSSPNYGDSDYWVVRLDDAGNTLWEKSYGGNSYDEANAVIEADDGGFVVAGYSYSGSNEIKTIPTFGTPDFWILRLSGHGDLLWQKSYGGVQLDWPLAIDRYGTNGLIVAGTSASPPGGNKETENYGGRDFWIIAIDQDGNKLWERSYGGDGNEEFIRLRQTLDGGFVALGWTSSGISGSIDCWMIRLNTLGEKIWERTFGQANSDFPAGLLQTLDGGFVLTGASSAVGPGPWTAWTLRLDDNGNKVWEHEFDLITDRAFIDIQSTQDGGLIAAGSVYSASQSADFLIVKLAPDALTAPQLELLRPSATGEGPKHIMLRGIAGRTYVAEDTMDFVTWLPFATNTLWSNSVQLLDQSANSERRFYRARMVP